jgi:hypothetical protein
MEIRPPANTSNNNPSVMIKTVGLNGNNAKTICRAIPAKKNTADRTFSISPLFVLSKWIPIMKHDAKARKKNEQTAKTILVVDSSLLKE